MVNSDAIERLLERLETRWMPKRDEIDRDIKEVDLLRNWEIIDNWEVDGANHVAGFVNGKPVVSEKLLHWDRTWSGGCLQTAFIGWRDHD
jgi:hypothetical protein